MTDPAPPAYPKLNGQSTMASTQDIPPVSQISADSKQNAPLSQNLKDTVSNGPVAQEAKAQYSATTGDFQNLANARQNTPSKAATGQQLTHYHSLFYSLLSWENPRATAITFLVNVLLIFAARYLNILRYVFKILYLTLGLTAGAEVAGKVLFSSGFASQIRPKKYFVIPKETLELILDDVQELINFFVIEFQRVLFAENVIHTSLGFVASASSYLLIKFVPLWGLALIGTCFLYLGPLVYLNNKELIDAQLTTASDAINKQASQIKDLAGHHTSQATESVKTYASEYTSKAQQYIGNARGRTGSPLDKLNSATTSSSSKAPGSTTAGSSIKSTDFPTAPKVQATPASNEFSASKPSQEPLVAL